MAKRINRAIELLEQDQPIYYDGGHTGHSLTYQQGLKDAHTWADYINVGMEHGAFALAGLDASLAGMVEAVDLIAAGKAPRLAQDESQASYDPLYISIHCSCKFVKSDRCNRCCRIGSHSRQLYQFLLCGREISSKVLRYYFCTFM